MQINSKAEFFRLWKAGVLGNRTNLWTDPREAYNSGAPEIGFRQIGRAGGGSWTKVARAEVYQTAEEWTKLGRNFVMDDTCPNHRIIFQGEICRTIRGLEGYFDTIGGLPMRAAMAAGHMRYCSYATCNALLDKFMDPSSRDDLDALFELFPDHTIEFSCFGCNVGIFPNRNTIFWEIRLY